MTEIPEAVLVAFRFAQALWPHDVAPGSEATAITWAPSLSGYSVDELCPALEGLARSNAKMPSLAVVLDELRERRRKAEPRPLLEPPAPAPALPRDAFLRESQRRRDEYTDQLVEQRSKIEGNPSPERVAEIRQWAAEVGPIEAAWLRKQGVAAEVTQPERPGGNLELDADEPPAPSLDEQAERWLQDWRSADAEQRAQMAAQTLTDEMKAAVKRLSKVSA